MTSSSPRTGTRPLKESRRELYQEETLVEETLGRLFTNPQWLRVLNSRRPDKTLRRKNTLPVRTTRGHDKHPIGNGNKNYHEGEKIEQAHKWLSNQKDR